MVINKKHKIIGTTVAVALVLSIVLIKSSEKEPVKEMAQRSTPPVAKEEVKKIIPLAWMEFVNIEPGNFMMGCDSSVDNCQDDELPLRQVEIMQSFSVSKFEVTQKAWKEIMGNNPATFVGEDRPVESVSFDDVQSFISKLNEIAGEAMFRLPTEAEWEYFARAGNGMAYPLGSPEQELVEFAWFGQLETTGTQAVGLMKPNAWGLHDVSGNVMEWVQDCYQEGYQKHQTQADAIQLESCDSHVLRGGSWIDSKDYVRLAYRNNWERGYRSHEVGFRLVKNL